MDDELAAFLRRHAPEVFEEVTWSPTRRFHLEACLTVEMPPWSS